MQADARRSHEGQAANPQDLGRQKVKLDVEIINNRAVHNSKFNKQHQVYRSCLTKQELLNLINEEIKLEEEQ